MPSAPEAAILSGMPIEQTAAPDVQVLYTSTHGHTAKVAGRVAETLRARGLDVDLQDLRARDPDPAGARAVIAAASLHQGHHQPEMVDWAKAHRDALAGRPSAFLSVSLTAADDTDEARAAARRCIDDFVEETGWAPGRTESVAGALQYREYDVFTRTLMRLMMRRGGHPTDASRDYDYTDWDALERFALEFAAALGRPG